MLVLRKPRSEQPQDWADIDRSTPAGKAISTLIPFGGKNFDLVTGTKVTFGAGGIIQPTPQGLTLRGSGASARASIPIDLSAHRILSLSFWMYWDTFANNDLLAMEFTANTNSNNGGFHIDPNNSTTAGTFQTVVGDSGVSSASSFGRPSAAQWHHYAFVWDRSFVSGDGQPSLRSAWVDAIAQTTTTRVSTYATATNFANSTLYFLSRGGSSLLATGNLQNVVLRAGYRLTDAEVLNEFQNPWSSLFEPQGILIPATIISTAYAPGTEADTALALTGVQVRATGLSSEADTALALAALQIKATGLASEADTALALGGVQLLAVGLAAEADTALALSGVQILAAGMAQETDTALALAPGAAPGATGLAVETDTAFALTALQLAAVGLAVETDAAFALTGAQLKAAGLASEVDTALALGAVQIGTTGLASETDSAFALVPFSPGGVGMAEEADTALALAAVQLRATGLASEADSALALTALQSKATGLALETDTALPLAGVQLKSVGLASETDTALGLSLFVPGGVGMAVETDTAFALAAVVIAPPDAAIQAGSSGGGARRGPHADEAANRRIKAMRDQEIHARNQQIIQAIVAMVTSGALDDMTVE
jgi:hypothetical protein